MRVLIFGPRTFTDAHYVEAFLAGLAWQAADDPAGLTIISGEATSGADQHATQFARNWIGMALPGWGEIHYDGYPAEWDVHHPDWCNGRCAGTRKERPYCSLAGFRRNQQMADEAKADLGAAFLDRPLEQCRGTKDMWTRASDAGIPLVRVMA